jgi:FtsP/CotA-like multicopper oxidase with cupredoxin domain
MAGFNGSVPGPTLRVRQGDTVTVVLRNRIGFPLTLHPHGLRLDPHYDGVPGFSQDSIPDGGEFAYRLVFPDAGVFWYHSHVREDAFLILGLYGDIVVTARDSSLWNPVDLEVPLIIGEVPLDSDGIAPIRKDRPDHVMMGRFGNVFLTNGEPYFTLRVKRMSYVRFFVTNACNSRVLNLGVEDNWMKIVGSDNGRYESSFLAGTEFFGPGERIVFETGFRDVDTLRFYHSTPAGNIPFGRIIVEADSLASGYTNAYFNRVDSVPAVVADIDRFRAAFAKPPDKRILFTGTMAGHGHMAMKTTASARQAHGPDGSIGIEWADTMGTMNSSSTPENMTWIIRDLETGLENHGIFWHFRQGDQVLIRIQNDSNAVHSMPHPIHFHGQRFLVVTVNGKRNLQMAWKDTYLVPAGATVDLLLDASNPGGWMAHCHIAEHAEGHMMFYYRVDG